MPTLIVLAILASITIGARAEALELNYRCQIRSGGTTEVIPDRQIEGSIPLARCGRSSTGLTVYKPVGVQCDRTDPLGFSGSVPLALLSGSPSSPDRVRAVATIVAATSISAPQDLRLCVAAFDIQAPGRTSTLGSASLGNSGDQRCTGGYGVLTRRGVLQLTGFGGRDDYIECELSVQR